jgi:hypothetical protein
VWGSAVQLMINLVGIVLAATVLLAVRQWRHGRRPSAVPTGRGRWRREGLGR